MLAHFCERDASKRFFALCSVLGKTESTQFLELQDTCVELARFKVDFSVLNSINNLSSDVFLKVILKWIRGFLSIPSSIPLSKYVSIYWRANYFKQFTPGKKYVVANKLLASVRIGDCQFQNIVATCQPTSKSFVLYDCAITNFSFEYLNADICLLQLFRKLAFTLNVLV